MYLELRRTTMYLRYTVTETNCQGAVDTGKRVVRMFYEDLEHQVVGKECAYIKGSDSACRVARNELNRCSEIAV